MTQTKRPPANPGRFIRDDSALLWWENLKVPSMTFPYDGNHEWLSIISQMFKTSSQFILLATDEENPPWLAYQGDLEQLLCLISNCRFFEYILFQPDNGLAIFDTHHNQLIVAESKG